MTTYLRLFSLLALSASTVLGCATQIPSDFRKLKPSAEHYTISGSIPPGFFMTATTVYKPPNEGCPPSSEAHIYGYSRQRAELDAIKGLPQGEYEYKSPTSIEVAGCRFRATTSHVMFWHRYEKHSTRKSYEMYFDYELVPTEEFIRHDMSQPLDQYRHCSVRFSMFPRSMHILKLLNCYETDSDGKRIARQPPVFDGNKMPGRTIHFHFTVDPKETPSDAREWVETADGYKRCVPNLRYRNLCTTTPEFMTFMLGERECEVYPGCTPKAKPPLD